MKNLGLLRFATDPVLFRMLLLLPQQCVDPGGAPFEDGVDHCPDGEISYRENAGEDHAWFVGYAPADDPEIVICVMIENAGNTGGAVCAPIVRDMIKHWCID